MVLPIVERACDYSDNIAVIEDGRKCTYAELLSESKKIAFALLTRQPDLNEARIAFLFPPGIEYIKVQWAVWQAGGIAVPLSTSHPLPELEYVITDSSPQIILAHKDYEEKIKGLADEKNIRYLSVDEIRGFQVQPLPDVSIDRRAMILYTSGTTGKPKGVVTTHANIRAQIESLVEAWEWAEQDRILEFLPLHHIHGIINITCCALWSGATVEMLPKFDAEIVWQRIVDSGLTLFMAIPTIYSKLADHWDKADPATQATWSDACGKIRLMVSGSAALPLTMLERWEAISKHRLLERYGMTEIGMAISNPLYGERLAGCIGRPLPGVQARLADDKGTLVEAEGVPGEIQIQGANVFKEYWQRPEETEKSFTDGWFKTGDVAVIEKGNYRILGRSSTDIIKTGGYKVSALEIEEVLRCHDAIVECAVVGLPDEEWGEVVAVAAVLAKGRHLDYEELRAWGKSRLAPYKVPTTLLLLDNLPRNAMGKVIKPEVVKLFRKSFH